MSDDPKSIWIFESDDRSVPRTGDWVDEQSEAPEGAPEYRRADLPPTLSAAMQLPEVWALIHAVVSQLIYMDMCGDHGDLYNRLKAALAAIKELKT